MTTLPQQISINQFLADGVTLDYTYNFLIPLNTDISVYITLPDATPSPSSDKQVLDLDYTVTGMGNVSGGVVTFLVAPVLGATVTLARDIQFEITTNFSAAQTISGVNLDRAFQRVTLMCQQLGSDYALRGLQYFINAVIPTNPENEATSVTNLPTLQDNQIWMGTDSLNVIAVTLEDPPDVSTLRSELASEVQNSDGASLIGYYDEYFNQPGTLAAFLNALPAYITDVVSGIIPTTGFQTGDRKPSWNPNAGAGWILEQNGTIGNTLSGASILADPTAQALFEMFWTVYGDSTCPVLPGGRGASANADWLADKTIGLPNVDGTAIVNYANTYVAGTTFGVNEVTLDANQMPAHTHDIGFSTWDYLANPTINKLAGGRGNVAASSFAWTTTSAGGSLPHENRQPSTACYIHIKL